MIDIKRGKGSGFKTEEGHICMERCFKCGRENYAMAVMSGCCAWCGHDANQEARDIEETQYRKYLGKS